MAKLSLDYQPEYLFDIKVDGGAKCDGSDDSDAIERTIALAIDYITPRQLSAAIRFPPGHIGHTRPIFQGHPKLAFVGCGTYATELDFLGTATGPNIIGAPIRTSGEGAPQYTAALGGQALNCELKKTGADYFFDLTSYQVLRLSGDWDITYAVANVARLPSAAEYALFLPATIYGRLYETHQNAGPVEVFVNYLGQLKLRFRHGGIMDEYQIATAGKSLVVPGDNLHLSISWDNAAKVLRVYLNGELWTMGHHAVTVGDGTGFRHEPWERFCVGSGYPIDYPNDSMGLASLPCVLRFVHVSNTLRHTGCSFTPVWDGDPVDSHTLLRVDWSRISSLGCAIGRSGIYNQDVHLYPTCVATNECPQLVLEGMGFVGGLGVRYEFASAMRASNLFHLYPGDGWQFLRNGYKSSFTNIGVAAGTGRGALVLGGSADCDLTAVHAAGPICYACDGVNVVMNNAEATIQGSYRLGFLFRGGGTSVVTCGGVDAEIPAPDFLAAALIENPQALTFIGSKLYTPPGSTKSPIWCPAPPRPQPDVRLNLLGCLLWSAPGTPLIKTEIPRAQPILVQGCSNITGSEICDIPSNVVVM